MFFIQISEFEPPRAVQQEEVGRPLYFTVV